MNKSSLPAGSSQDSQGLREYTKASAYLPSLLLSVLTDRAAFERLGHEKPNI